MIIVNDITVIFKFTDLEVSLSIYFLNVLISFKLQITCTQFWSLNAETVYRHCNHFAKEISYGGFLPNFIASLQI